MPRPSLLSPLLTGAVLLAVLHGCDTPTSTPAPSPASATPSASSAALARDVLATVNGVAIRLPDLHYVLAKDDRGRGRGADAARSEAALEELIDKELTRQQAEALGLDAEPEYQKKLRFMEAPLNDFKRKELTELYLRRELSERSRVDPAAVRKYFDENSARLRTEVHLFQILVRSDEAVITDMKREIDGGAPFEEVAAKRFPTPLPPSNKAPWDMGVLRWHQVPESWRAPLEGLKDGQVSEVIRGPKGRFWLVKLVERRVNDAITFAELEPVVRELVQSAKVADFGRTIRQELRQRAAIVRVREPGVMPPPPEPDD